MSDLKFSIEVKDVKFHYDYQVYSSKEFGESHMSTELYILFADCLRKLSIASDRSREERMRNIQKGLTDDQKENA